ncbi:MAG: hypothetical protein ABR587_10180 [Candidatus Binatia bacterium]
MTFESTRKSLTLTTFLAASLLLAAVPAQSAPDEAEACAIAIAKAMSKCTKKSVITHSTCYKKTGAACAPTNEKLVGAENKAGDAIRKKCSDASILAAGFGPYTPTNLELNVSIMLGKRCAMLSELASERTFGTDGSLYTAADSDGKKCLVAAAKATAKQLSGDLKDVSKCVEDGCTFDFSERAATAVAAIAKKCDDFATVNGRDTATYVAGTTAQSSAALGAPCDSLDGTRCAFPYPNDFHTLPGAGTETGRQLALNAFTITAVGNGVPVNPARWNETDGFSNGPMMLLSDVNIDLAVTGAAPITDLAQSLDANAPFMLIDAETGDKQLMWWERDLHGDTIADQPIIGRVARNLKENHRYIVAIRNAKDSSNAAVPAGSLFALYRDQTPSGLLPVESRRAHMEDIFTILTSAGVTRSELYLAWDFTTQSTNSTTNRLLSIRDDAFDILGADAPAFTVNSVTEPLDANVFRRIDGTFQVPLYLTDAGIPGSTLRTDANGVPVNTGDFFTASFRCVVPYAATTGGAAPAVPARISMYGHGLLGSHTEVTAGNVRAFSNEHNIIFCATDWTGFSSGDSLYVFQVVTSFSLFPNFIDRQHQGLLNFMYLSRLLTHANGFASDSAFQVGGESMLDTSAVFYDGNSQGGILGGVLAAFEQTATRFSLGVPGINYSTLLHRSVDFAPFDDLLKDSYPQSTDRNLLLSLAQNIWDRTDPSGHVNHVTADPYPNTPAKKILYQVAFGDHQVAPVTAEIAARNIGASIHTPTLVPGKVVPEVTPYYDIPAIGAYPFDGSALVIWDSGNPAPPIGNIPPAEITNMDPEWADLGPCAQGATGGDPHSCPRSNVDARIQKSEFLKTGGSVVDVCSGLACEAP